MCRGVQIHVTDRDRFLPFDTGVRTLGLIRRLHPEEYRARSFLANLYGSGEILADDFSPDRSLAAAKGPLEEYKSRLLGFRLYEDA